MPERVEDALRRCRADEEKTFFALADLPGPIVPDLRAAHLREADPDLRAILVPVAWRQRRGEPILGFLVEALDDPHPEVWKQALNGRVALGSTGAVRALAAEADPARKAWIEEAAEQIDPNDREASPGRR